MTTTTFGSCTVTLHEDGLTGILIAEAYDPNYAGRVYVAGRSSERVLGKACKLLITGDPIEGGCYSYNSRIDAIEQALFLERLVGELVS